MNAYMPDDTIAMEVDVLPGWEFKYWMLDGFVVSHEHVFDFHMPVLGEAHLVSHFETGRYEELHLVQQGEWET